MKKGKKGKGKGKEKAHHTTDGGETKILTMYASKNA
jgi:hypothetical protein